MNDDTQFSRLGCTSAMGKFDAQMERINIHQATLDRLKVQAADAGLNFSEYVRAILEVKAFGFEHVAMMQTQHLRRIVSADGN